MANKTGEGLSAFDIRAIQAEQDVSAGVYGPKRKVIVGMGELGEPQLRIIDKENDLRSVPLRIVSDSGLRVFSSDPTYRG